AMGAGVGGKVGVVRGEDRQAVAGGEVDGAAVPGGDVAEGVLGGGGEGKGGALVGGRGEAGEDEERRWAGVDRDGVLGAGGVAAVGGGDLLRAGGPQGAAEEVAPAVAGDEGVARRQGGLGVGGAEGGGSGVTGGEVAIGVHRGDGEAPARPRGARRWVARH